MACVWGALHDPGMATRKKSRKPRKKRIFVDVCGQEYEIVVDPNLKIDGECSFSENIIRIKPGMAFWRSMDTILHELLHAIFDASGLGWTMRQRLKMSKAEWHKFEEDFIIRPMTPALLSTLKSAVKAFSVIGMKSAA